ncbi:MAG: hypothetical protein WBP79_10725 [Candidatus Acidiferrales bacterium]
MVFLKSLVGGIVALFLALLVLYVCSLTYFLLFHKPDGSIGWDLVSLSKQPKLWIPALLIFAIGFYWEHRALSR